MAIKMSASCGILTVTSCLLTLIAAVFHIVAFATPGWIVSDGTSPFVRFGFHEACFNYCQDPYCPTSGSDNVYFNGCSWLYDWYYDEIRPWLMPDWFKEIRVLAIVNVPLLLCAFIVMCVCSCLACAGKYTPEVNVSREKILQAFLFFGATLVVVGLLMNVVILIQWYTSGFQLGWMPMPEKNRFGYSFWLDFTGTVLLIFGSLCAIVAAIFRVIVMHSDKDPRYSEEMMYSRGQGLSLSSR